MNKDKIITGKKIIAYKRRLIEEEKCDNTISAYLRTIKALYEFIGTQPLTKELLLSWKKKLCESYSPNSVNRTIAAVNSFLKFCGLNELVLKPLKIQHRMFSEEKAELSRKEYEKLLFAAKESGNERLYLILQTICATGIRVSELKFITVEAVSEGRAKIACKGKRRTVFLPEKLAKMLKKYIAKRKICGCVFVTRSGKSVDRSNIWREMKKLSESARVPKEKLFPHNLRHLFARTYYTTQKDLSRLADILGHSNVSTTRIYTRESGEVHARQIEKLGLIYDLTT